MYYSFEEKRGELLEEAGIQQKDISVRTVSRFLNSQNYYYLQTRRKGLMTAEDHIKRVKFAKYMKGNYSQEVWTEGIAFYLDGTGFTYKRYPPHQARAPKARVWRKKSVQSRHCQRSMHEFKRFRRVF